MADFTPPLQGFWSGKRVLVTGHTGFKGSWFSYWLHLMGAQVAGFARAPQGDPNLFSLLGLPGLVQSQFGEITDTPALRDWLAETRPECVFHLAAQAQVLPSFAEPAATFSTNVQGTVEVLDAVRASPSVRVCQIVTSDKCYAQPGSGLPFAEDDPLGGSDPYSASKAAAELVVAAYRQSFFGNGGDCSVATVRVGNALGAGDWSEHRLLPNSIRALRADRPIPLTQPQAVRPWQYVLEPLSGYLSLAQHQWDHPQAFAQAWNFGPHGDAAVPVLDLAQRVIAAWGSGALQTVAPDSAHPAEAPNLQISIAKAQQQLAWQPAFDLDQTVASTVHGYRALYDAMAQPDCQQRVRAWCEAAIAAYTRAAQAKGIAWASDAH